MVTKKNFRQYFKRNLLLAGGFGIGLVGLRMLGGHETSLLFGGGFVLFLLVLALIHSHMSYRFNEKHSQKTITNFFDKSPLAAFKNIGFVKDDDTLEGQINDYKVFLSPVTNSNGTTWLLVSIPIQPREGLESYFARYNDQFNFAFSGEVIFAEAVLKNFDSAYDHPRLLDLLKSTTASLRENKIDPLNVAEELNR